MGGKKDTNRTRGASRNATSRRCANVAVSWCGGYQHVDACAKAAQELLPAGVHRPA